MSELTIYPWPSSYREFCDRNPEITDLESQLHALNQEVSLWKATSPDVDLARAKLELAEQSHRELIETAKKTGACLIELVTWPKVGEYEVPEDLKLAA